MRERSISGVPPTAISPLATASIFAWGGHSRAWKQRSFWDCCGSGFMASLSTRRNQSDGAERLSMGYKRSLSNSRWKKPRERRKASAFMPEDG